MFSNDYPVALGSIDGLYPGVNKLGIILLCGVSYKDKFNDKGYHTQPSMLLSRLGIVNHHTHTALGLYSSFIPLFIRCRAIQFTADYVYM
jgi:hypothetical protein